MAGLLKDFFIGVIIGEDLICGVDGEGFACLRSKGDAALFGGNTTQTMKNRLSVPENRPLADFLPTITI